MRRRKFISIFVALFALMINPLNLIEVYARNNSKFIGKGVASGKNRAIRAANQALSNTLLNKSKLSKYRRVTVKILGSKDLSLYDVEEASSIVYSNSHTNVDINFITIIDDRFGNKIKVSVVGA